MDDKKKKYLGFLSFWPLIYFPLFMIAVFLFTIFGGLGGNISVIAFGLLMLMHFLTIIIAIGIWIYYIVDTFKNPNVGEDNKIVWVLALVFGGVLVTPFYWWFNIWKGEFPEEEGHRPYGLDSGDQFQSRVSDTQNSYQGEPRVPEPMSWRDDD